MARELPPPAWRGQLCWVAEWHRTAVGYRRTVRSREADVSAASPGGSLLRALSTSPDLESQVRPRDQGPATDEYILTALRSGASGFLLKDTEPEQLAQLVRTLAAGGVVMSPKASRALLRSHPGAGAPQDADVARVGLLSDRERDVLVLIAEGLSNADIGTRIHLSQGTVKDHVSSILTKLRVTSRVQAALLAERAGLLTHNDDTARDNGR